MQQPAHEIEGELYPVTLLGRWIDRSQGRDDAELEREARQREVQQRRRGSWGGHRATAALPTRPVAGRAIPPRRGGDARRGGDLMSYGELYALWERQNWQRARARLLGRPGALAGHPREAQEHTTWSLGSFYIGEERVTADLAPFLHGGAERRDRGCSSPPSSSTRRATPRSSTASAPR